MPETSREIWREAQDIVEIDGDLIASDQRLRVMLHEMGITAQCLDVHISQFDLDAAKVLLHEERQPYVLERVLRAIQVLCRTGRELTGRAIAEQVIADGESTQKVPA